MLQRLSSVATRCATAGAVGIAIAGAWLLAGCGQKGPLTLPKPLPVAPSASAPASAASAS